MLGLVVILALAAILRAIGLDYGLPGIYNPDETPILNRAVALGEHGLRPQNFVYPSLYFYLLFVWEGLFFLVGRALGLFESLAAFQREFFVDPSRHFLAGRILSVVCGTLTVAAVYALGNRLYDRRTGLVSALALAVSPIAVRDAHYVKLDVPTAMLVAVAHVALARIVVNAAAASRRRTWIAAGIVCGLAVSTQYYAIFLGFTMLAVAVVDRGRTGRWRTTAPLLAWSVAGAAIGFVAGSPFVPFELPRVVADIAHVREVDIDRATSGGHFTAVVPYLRILFQDAVGWPVWIAAVAGAVWALALDWRRGLLLVSFFVPFFLFIANTVPMSRYLNVVLPLIATAAGVALVRLGRLVVRAPTLATVVLVGAATIPGLLGSLEWDLFLRQADTRTLAGAFIEAHVPPGSSVLTQPSSVPLRQSREGLRESLRAHLGSESRASTKFQQILALDPYPEPSYRLIYFGDRGLDVDKIYVLPTELTADAGLAPLRRRGIEYVALKRSHLPNPEQAGLEAALARDGRLLARFTPYRSDADAAAPPFVHNTAAVIHPALERPGPIVEVWAVVAQPVSRAVRVDEVYSAQLNRDAGRL